MMQTSERIPVYQGPTVFVYKITTWKFEGRMANTNYYFIVDDKFILHAGDVSEPLDSIKIAVWMIECGVPADVVRSCSDEIRVAVDAIRFACPSPEPNSDEMSLED